MTTAYVDDVISSYRVSTKMASPIASVGRIFQDRSFSIAGQLTFADFRLPQLLRQLPPQFLLHPGLLFKPQQDFFDLDELLHHELRGDVRGPSGNANLLAEHRVLLQEFGRRALPRH